jgi:hypothetical protein
MSLKILGTSVSFQFRNEKFCARSRTIPQDSGIGSAAGRPARARGMDAPSQHKGLRVSGWKLVLKEIFSKETRLPYLLSFYPN